MKTRLHSGLSVLITLALATSFVAVRPFQEAQDAVEAKRARLKDNAADFWIYDDIDAGTSRAAESGKPLLISFRCVP